VPTRVVIDGLPITGMSLGIVVEHLLEGWHSLESGDELHLVIGPGAQISIPPSVTVHQVDFGPRPFVSRLRAQSVDVPRVCRAVEADVMLGVLPTTTVSPLPCPRTMIAYDVRHELRPEQFSAWTRWSKKISYDIGFYEADGISCISERTRQDLMATHPRLRNRVVRVAHLGADHVDSWPVRRPARGYAIAFGQYGNKNVDLVVDAWSRLHADGEDLPLALVGLSETARATVQAKVDRAGLTGFVEVLPWLPIESFQERFASASLVVFPSDFEGFGLPAAEAMRLGIPLVITPDPALLEVTGGHAVVTDDDSPEGLAKAVTEARRTTPAALAAALEHAAQFTWANTASRVREMLGEAIAWSKG
jgi:glycosyltransferase involved in cell wall biosynthesis